MSNPVHVTIYGASDDLVEIEVVSDGKIVLQDEAYLTPGGSRIRLTDTDDNHLDVMADFGASSGALDSDDSPGGWVLAVVTHGPLPDGWEVVFGARENDPETEDPALTVRCPAGTGFEVVR